MESINNFTSQKTGSGDVTFTHTSMHQMQHAQSGHSTRSALDINTLGIFTNEPIMEQEIK